MFLKPDKHIHLSPNEILKKYNRNENPFTENITSRYDNEPHSPLVLAKYLNRDGQFLEAILEANKGKLKEDSPIYKEVTLSLRLAENDLERARKNFAASQAKLKNLKVKKDVNIESEFRVAEKALTKCNEHYERMQSFKTYLDEMEKDSLKDTWQLKENIKSLKNQVNELTDLANKGDVIHKKYLHLWGENEENIERKLEAKEQKIDKKEIAQYEKMVSRLAEICKNLPQQHEFLDKHLEDSLKSHQASKGS
jgi:hypothetical protein